MAGGVDPFRVEPGLRSGRIDPSAISGIAGDYVYCFGSDQAGWTQHFAPGDEVSVSQTGDWTPAEVLRWYVRTRGPSEMPAGWAWYFVARIGASEVWRVAVDAERERTLPDLGVTTSSLAATITLSFALLVEGPVGETAELEIPAVYLDDLILDASADDYLVANRDPAEAATRVPRDTFIAFDLLDTTGSLPSAADTQIWVDGVLAYDGALGGAQVGFTVTESVPLGGQRRFVVDTLPAPFESEAVVTVRVVSSNSVGSASCDETWHFTVVDETPPRLEVAQARELRRVRATFNEAMEYASASGLESALNAALWSLEPIQPDAETPAVPVGVAGVEFVTDTVFDVLLDDDPSPGIEYDLVVVDVADSNGNAIIAPLNRARFTAFVPPQPTGRRWLLWEMIPVINRDEDESGTKDLLKFVRCLQEIEDLRWYDLDRWVLIHDVDVCDERYLDAILVGLGNPFPWVEDLSVVDKRRLARVLVAMYRQKGTADGIENVIRFFLGIEVEVVPYSGFGWILDVHELGIDTDLGTGISRLRYSFEIVTLEILDDEQRTRIAQIANLMKVAHEHHVRTIDGSSGTATVHMELGISLLFEDEWILH